MSINNRTIFIDPSYRDFNSDGLFDLENPILNRDGQLLPLSRLRAHMANKGVNVRTADYLFKNEYQATAYSDYYSLGLLDNYAKLIDRKDVRLRGFLIMEPPVVAPHLYRALPELTRHFDRVFVHNTVGDGYSLKGVDQSKLYTFYWPQPYPGVLESHWSKENRQNRIVVINGNHIPRSLFGQLYGKRIEVMARLAKLGVVDLFGQGWDKWWSHRSMWPPYWFNFKALMSIYKGPCDSKFEVLSGYRFSLCFENMTMKGYLTEKLFDCLYAGTIPLYLGARNVEELIPSEAYIDCRKFTSWEEMVHKVTAMTNDEVNLMRLAGKKFIQSEDGLKFYNSLINIFDDQG